MHMKNPTSCWSLLATYQEQKNYTGQAKALEGLSPPLRLQRLHPQFSSLMRSVPLNIISLLRLDKNDEFVSQAFREILLRSPDPRGLAHYLENLQQQRMNRRQVLYELYFSKEGQAIQRRILGGHFKVLKLLYRWRKLVQKTVGKAQWILNRHRSQSL